MSVSPVCRVSVGNLSSAVAACLSIRPVSATCVSVISWSLPNCIVPPSARNKSENSAAAVPSVAPSALAGTIEVPTVAVFKTGLVNVLFVSVSDNVNVETVAVPTGKVTVTSPEKSACAGACSCT